MSTAGDETPSVDGNTPNKLHPSAPKNKQCPFCHESFTSSSLGRHLDLYIKEKNPKASDGIHDVDKIRQIRSAITRRQPRRSTKALDDSNPPTTGGSRNETPQHNVASPYGIRANEKASRWAVNKPTWEATGVMTDLPPTPTLGLDNNMRNHLSRSDVALRKRMAEDRTRLRATELALQELLDSVNAARLLQQQPSLQSVQVIENPEYCPIGPPSQKHYELLRKVLEKKLDEFVVNQARAMKRRSSLRGTISGSPSSPQHHHETFDPSRYTSHLTQAWEVWKATPEPHKTTQWHVEVFRALNSCQAEEKRLSDALNRSNAEQEHLRVQIERLNECQQPKEYTFQIPSNWHVTKETASVLVSHQVDAPPDRETLINKWTQVVRGNSKFQRALPDIGLVDVTTDPDGMYIDSQVPNGIQEVDEDEEEDGDSADAAGEEDEDADDGKTRYNDRRNQNMETNFLDRDILDPGLRGDGDMEVDGRDYGAEMLLAARSQRVKGYGMQ